MALNIALLTLPIFYALLLAPHLAAAGLVIRADAHAFENVNPRSGATTAAYKKLLGPRDFARWERCKAANLNGYESFPLFAAAVLAGLHAGLPARVMDGFGLGVVALRGVYNVLYIRTETSRNSHWRSACWASQAGACLVVLGAAAFAA